MAKTLPEAVSNQAANLANNMANSMPTFQRPKSLFTFLLDLRRWSTPKTGHQWTNRIRNNLLYFQTNYVILGLLSFVVFMLMSMKTVVTGLLSAGLIILAIMFFTDNIPHAREIKQNHPNVVVVCSIFMIILAWHSLYTVIVVLSALLSSIPLWILHASLRDSSNLVSAVTGRSQYANSPMGHVMSLVMVEPIVTTSE